MNDTQTISYTAPDGNEMRKHLSSSEKRKLKAAFGAYRSKNPSAAPGDNSLPAWIYIITACILAAVLAAVFSCIK